MDKNLAVAFERVAAIYPPKTVLETEADKVTYDELNKAGNRIAHFLAARYPTATPVAIIMNQTWELWAADLGVMKAGMISARINPNTELDRVHAILNYLDPALTLVDSAGAKLIGDRSHRHVRQLIIDDDLSNANLRTDIASDAPSHILLTSGTTGEPKGVLTTHFSELFTMEPYLRYLRASDRISLVRHSANANTEMYMSILSGATGALYPLSKRAELRKGVWVGVDVDLSKWLIDERITVFTSVTTTFRAFANQAYPDLRLVRAGGEMVLPADFKFYQDYLPEDCLFLIRYATAESLTVTLSVLDKSYRISDGVLPVGYPAPGVEVIILDPETKSPVKEGPGEIAVKSPALSVGYWNDPELTAAKFIPDPRGHLGRVYCTRDKGYLRPDGMLVHQGRL